MDSEIVNEIIEPEWGSLHLSQKLAAYAGDGDSNQNELYHDNKLLLKYKVNSDGVVFVSADGKPLNIMLPSVLAAKQTNLRVGYNIPADKSDYCLIYRYVVIYCEPYYLSVEILAADDAHIMTDRDRSRLTLTGSRLTVNLDCFDSEDDVLLAMWRYHLSEYHWRNFAVGVIIDYQDKRSDAMVYADICHRLECQNILLLVKNFQTDVANQNELLLDTLQKRAALCSAKLILEYDGSADSSNDECDYIMMRAGHKLDIYGKTFIDVLGTNGLSCAASQLRECISHCDGIRFKMLFENEGELDFDKIMVHSESNLIEYRSSVGKILTALSQASNDLKGSYRFVKNVFSSACNELDMILSDNVGEDTVSIYEQIISQGYLNISIESDITNMTTDIWALSEKLLPIFLTHTFIVTQDFVQKISAKDELFKYFNEVSSFRQSLDILYYDIYHNTNGLTSFPYKTFCRGKKHVGLLLDNTLYVGLSVLSLLRKVFILPDIVADSDNDSKSSSKWYDIVNSCILSSGNYLNRTKSGLHYFLAENHILILNEPNVSKDKYNDLRIIVFCTQRSRIVIAESDDVLHKFDVNIIDGTITIEYETNPVSRMITFEIVLADEDTESAGITKSVNYNGDEIFCSQDGIILKFMSSNILAKNVIKII